MAFGKKSENLDNVGSFRQTAGAWNRSKQERAKLRTNSGGGSGVPSWVNEYKPPTTELDLVRLIAGHYTVQEPVRNADGSFGLADVGPLPFYPYVEHYDSRTKRRGTCSAGPFANFKDKRDKCHGCDLYFSSMKRSDSGKMERGFMGRSDRVAFTVLHYHNYHKAPQIDKATGKPRLNPSTEQPYFSWVRCAKSSNGRGKCELCDASIEMKFGHRMHWAMGNDHANTLLDKESEIGESCVNCKTMGSIVSDAWVCSNADCGEAIIDDPTSLKPSEVQEIISSPVICRACGIKGMANEVIHCEACSDGKRAGLFDVDLKVKRVEPQDGTNRTTLSISSVHLQDIQADLKALAVPERLDLIYAPTPLEMQAVLFQVGPTRTPVTSSRPYSR